MKQGFGDYIQSEEGVLVLAAALAFLTALVCLPLGIRRQDALLIILGIGGAAVGLGILYRLMRQRALRAAIGEVFWEFDFIPERSDETARPGDTIACSAWFRPAVDVEILEATLYVIGARQRKSEMKVRRSRKRWSLYWTEILGHEQVRLCGSRRASAGEKTELEGKIVVPRTASPDDDACWSLGITISFVGLMDWNSENILDIQLG